jgi:hypothetical protein
MFTLYLLLRPVPLPPAISASAGFVEVSPTIQAPICVGSSS